MSFISIVKRITVEPHSVIAYELNNQVFVMIVSSNGYSWIHIHILNEQDLDNEVSQYIVVQLDNVCFYEKMYLKQINLNLSLIILQVHRKADRDDYRGLRSPCYFFYSFELSTRRVKLVYKPQSDSNQTLKYPLFYELNLQKTLTIIDLSKLPEIKQLIIKDVKEYTFVYEKANYPLFLYKKKKANYWSKISELGQNETQQYKLLSLLNKDARRVYLKITNHGKKQINIEVIKSSKKLYTFQGKIFRMKPHLKIVRTLKTIENDLIDDTPYLLQHGISYKASYEQDTILTITNAQVVFELGKSDIIMSRNQLIARYISDGGDVEIIKISKE